MTENENSAVQPESALQILGEKVKVENEKIQLLKSEIAKVIVGQEHMVDRLLIALLCNGHILLEGVPGLAKTLAIKTLSDALEVSYNRIQFTPDLLPADITGTQLYDQKSGGFTVRKGPVFANFILADEINRAPAKVQSALLEAMQERQITIGDESFQLDEPFLVLATMNPIDQEGTYPLPEAQVDRFMMKVVLGYPTKEEEKQILRINVRPEGMPKIVKVLSKTDILSFRELVKEVYLDEKIEQYIIDIVFATRTPDKFGLGFLEPLISFGCSPRASINLALTAKAHAFLNNRAFVIPEDVRAVAPEVIRHRMGLSYEAEAENMTATDILSKIIGRIQVP
ncbi:MoxR family ATPase [Crocinitomicaceae bacterium]|jgi:MoxR-like ATPase|uniref:ATPase family protein n=1 Tax=uncultured Flavobacteriia bacterium TaxID=212695 RepID=H6RGD1_9BACT|nr:ATPase AAA [uncultured bacterium]MDB0062956.1 MoxR family ATPase [Crocinitomicaceae bacterium]CCG00092.1 ATPase family protein [uncultured Flavobacteriia bacterium]MDC1194277.1 MoxR family ATPase [Crocinitomicaceae bacterium]MDG1346923.1 MoxR family ATPase [Crocinitomicaceae bacterium]